MLRECEEEREAERLRAVNDSPIGEACECTRCGAWFPKSASWEMAICDSCWDDLVSKD